MEINKSEISGLGVKFTVDINGSEIGRAYLYVLKNDLHYRPFGFIEDVFVNEKYRGEGVGSKLVEGMIEEAKQKDCYKIILTSRYSKPEVHRLYMDLGFIDHGKEFRMDIGGHKKHIK